MANTVYVAMSGDIIHHGQINIIKTAMQYGEVIVGLHTDEVISSYWRIPILSYDERYAVVSNIKGVSRVMPQKELDQTNNLRALKPDYVVHGDDWQKGPEKPLRDKVIAVLNEWGGKLIEVGRTKGVALDRLTDLVNHLGVTTDIRRASLRKLIGYKKHLRIMEAHNGLTGIIVEKTRLPEVDTGYIREFDGMWLSSLCDSTAKGKPDIEVVDITSRMNTINEIMEVTSKPMIVDGDTGGLVEHFVYTVRSMERIGVSAIIIEDKIGLKKNSLFGTEVQQQQAEIHDFCEKIKAGKKACLSADFMIIARIESLILGKGMSDALERAKNYIDAGADGIMIHSIDKTGEEIFAFTKEYQRLCNGKIPLVVVPTAYDTIYEQELFDSGVNIVIYANQLLRAGYKAMQDTAIEILEHGRGFEADDKCISIREVINLIDTEEKW